MASTVRLRNLLNEIFSLGRRSPILSSEYVRIFLKHYDRSNKNEKYSVLSYIAESYHLDPKTILNELSQVQNDKTNIIQKCQRLNNLTQPKYTELFHLIGRQEEGVKQLVKLRSDLLNFLDEPEYNVQSTSEIRQYLKRMSEVLKQLLATWFTTGLLSVERVTWQSPCEIVQRVSEYEAVHPIRTWVDLKRRLGPYRRCFVYTHFMMKNDPLVILHVALMDNISDSIQEIIRRVTLHDESHTETPTSDSSLATSSTDSLIPSIKSMPSEENPEFIHSAIFYSISSTQSGLRGIELGNSLIKRCVQDIQIEYPKLQQFSSLSPIPGFRAWLTDKIKHGCPQLLSLERSEWLKSVLATNIWHLDTNVLNEIKPILMKLCAHYLYVEKQRGFALNPVTNFHLKNGACIWRLNWLADTSERGLKSSCTMMVNYRYYLNDIEQNSIEYIDKKVCTADEQFLKWLT